MTKFRFAPGGFERTAAAIAVASLSVMLATGCAAPTKFAVTAPLSFTETKDRIDTSEIDEMIRPAIDLVEAGRIPQAEAEFARLLASNGDGVHHVDARELDLVTAFAVQLWISAEPASSFPYLRRAVQLAETDFGPRHPETALAYTDLGDCLGKVEANRIGAERLQAYRLAHSIRVESLGKDNPETIAAALNLSEFPGPDSATTAQTGESEGSSEVIYSGHDVPDFGPDTERRMALAGLAARQVRDAIRNGRISEAKVGLRRLLRTPDLTLTGMNSVMAACDDLLTHVRAHPSDGSLKEWSSRCSAFEDKRYQPLIRTLQERAN